MIQILLKKSMKGLARNMDIDPPVNYFKDGPDGASPVNRWKAHATLLFMNWLNYYVYQETPYEWK